MTKYLALLVSALAFALLATTGMAATDNDDTESAMEFFRGDPATGYPPPDPLLVNPMARDYQSLNGPGATISTNKPAIPLPG